MFYILNNSYFPNTAVSNRLMGYYAAFDKLCTHVTAVYIYPDSKYSRIQNQYKYVEVLYLWKHKIYNNRYVRYCLSYINILRFILRLKKGDIVYTYGLTPATKLLLLRRGIRVFAEQTEHLSIMTGGRFSLTQEDKGKIAKQLDGIFVISRPLKQSFVQLGISEDKVHIINMIVDSKRFDFLSKSLVRTRYIAYCGTATNQKDGVGQLIKAFSIVAKRINDVNLYIMGSIPSEEEKQAVLELIQSYDLINRIILTGTVPADSMPQLLKDAEVLALSRPDNLQAKYGFPTKLGEYLLTGNPVVVTKVGDIPYFLKDGESALIPSTDTPSEFADKLIWALNNPKEASRIGQNGARVAMCHFNNVVETSKLLKCIYADR